MATVDTTYLQGWAENTILRAMRNLAATEVRDGRRRKIDTTGRLRNSLRSEIVELYDQFIVEFSSTEEYAVWVEEGRKPGTPPPTAPLLEWIKKKPLRVRDKKTGVFVSATERRRLSTAFAIARNIGKYGTRATRFMSRAVTDSLDELPEAVRSTFESKIEVSIEAFLKKQTA